MSEGDDRKLLDKAGVKMGCEADEFGDLSPVEFTEQKRLHDQQ